MLTHARQFGGHRFIKVGPVMEFVIFLAVVIWIISLVSKGVQKAKTNQAAEEAAKLRQERMAASRAAILNSGDLVAIHRLNIMESAGEKGGASTAASRTARSGPGMLGTAASVAGGIVAGNAITGAIASAELEAILAGLEADFSEVTTAGLDGGLDTEAEDQDLNFDV